MKVRALKNIVTNDHRGLIEAGEVFECPKERAEKLLSFGSVEKVVDSKPVAPKKSKSEKVVIETKEEKQPKKDK